jgi:hypothetical protein
VTVCGKNDVAVPHRNVFIGSRAGRPRSDRCVEYSQEGYWVHKKTIPKEMNQ